MWVLRHHPRTIHVGSLSEKVSFGHYLLPPEACIHPLTGMLRRVSICTCIVVQRLVHSTSIASVAGDEPDDSSVCSTSDGVLEEMSITSISDSALCKSSLDSEAESSDISKYRCFKSVGVLHKEIHD